MVLGADVDGLSGDNRRPGCDGWHRKRSRPLPPDRPPAGGGDLTNGLNNLHMIGIQVTSADITPSGQLSYVGKFSSAERYGSVVVVNRGGAAFHSDAVEMSILLSPIKTVVID